MFSPQFTDVYPSVFPSVFTPLYLLRYFIFMFADFFLYYAFNFLFLIHILIVPLFSFRLCIYASSFLIQISLCSNPFSLYLHLSIVVQVVCYSSVFFCECSACEVDLFFARVTLNEFTCLSTACDVWIANWANVSCTLLSPGLISGMCKEEGIDCRRITFPSVKWRWGQSSLSEDPPPPPRPTIVFPEGRRRRREVREFGPPLD